MDREQESACREDTNHGPATAEVATSLSPGRSPSTFAVSCDVVSADRADPRRLLLVRSLLEHRERGELVGGGDDGARRDPVPRPPLVIIGAGRILEAPGRATHDGVGEHQVVRTQEMRGHVLIHRVAPGGPAAAAGITANAIITAVGGRNVSSLAEFYRAVWALGDAGVTVPLTQMGTPSGLAGFGIMWSFSKESSGEE